MTSPEIQLPVTLNLFTIRTTKRNSHVFSLPHWHFPHGHVGETAIQSPGLSDVRVATDALIKGREPVPKTFADSHLCKQPCSLLQDKNGY